MLPCELELEIILHTLWLTLAVLVKFLNLRYSCSLICFYLPHENCEVKGMWTLRVFTIFAKFTFAWQKLSLWKFRNFMPKSIGSRLSILFLELSEKVLSSLMERMFQYIKIMNVSLFSRTGLQHCTWLLRRITLILSNHFSVLEPVLNWQHRCRVEFLNNIFHFILHIA